MSNEALMKRIAELEAEVEKAKAPAKLKFKVSTKGAVSIYNLGQRFPATLYAGQWEQILAQAEALKAFIASNEENLERK